jgi:anti-sigma B factor antagonist
MPRPQLTVAPTIGSLGPCLRVVGELDIATGPLLRDALLRFADGGEGTILVDMAGVGFIDSSGISVLVDVQNRLGYQGRSLELHHVSAEVHRILDVVGLTERLRVDETTLSD